MSASNTPSLWNDVWKRTSEHLQDSRALEREAASIRWRRIEKRLLRGRSCLVGLRVVEIGAGMGVYAALFAQRGAVVTVLDYSDGALARSREFFERHGLTATFLQADALDLPHDLRGGFDVAMSFGLAEHFTGERRIEIVRAHFLLLDPGGMAIVSVPNALNVPYRLFKFASERTGEWSVGEEHPFTRGELTRIATRLGIEDYSFFGDSLISSLDFVRRTPGLRRFLLRRTPGDRPPSRELGTPLDGFLSYALVLCAKRGTGFRTT